MPMDALRKYMWVWVIIGMIFVISVISGIFILINKCISRRGKRRITSAHLHRKESDYSNSSNRYQETNLKAAIPPLPPRTQFLTAEAQSYENLAEVPEYEQSMPDYEQSKPDYEQSMPDYEQSMPDYEQSMPDYVQSMPDYEQSMPDYVQSMPDYEQSMPDYVQSMDEPPDYLQLEDEVVMLPPPLSHEDPDAAADTSSTEDYDDIGGEDENQDEEDYDDLG